MSEIKIADTQNDIHELIRERFSPYVFAPDRVISRVELSALFEAASWAASSFNEQPWRYIIATQDDEAAFGLLWSCLSEGNQGWAKDASVLALGIYRTEFTHNDKPNRSALHDLGAAAATLTFEATRRGLVVHQMAGILPDRAREVYDIPKGFEVATAIAIGYEGNLGAADEKMRARDSKPRSRKPLEEFVFTDTWGNAAF